MTTPGAVVLSGAKIGIIADALLPDLGSVTRSARVVGIFLIRKIQSSTFVIHGRREGHMFLSKYLEWQREFVSFLIRGSHCHIYFT